MKRHPDAQRRIRQTIFVVTFMLTSIGYAAWVAWTATMWQMKLAEETQRLLAENAQAATAAVVARGTAGRAVP